ncbi:MAG: sigma 54-interacting transcriptional regulator, partial [Nitrospinota bacterium]
MISDSILKNHAEDLAIVNKTGEVVTSLRTINEMANEIAISINNRFEADEINIIRYDKESNQLTTLAKITSNQESSNTQAVYPLSNGMNSWIVNNARSLLIREDSLSECESLGIRHGGKPAKSWIGVPMCYRNTIIGVLSLQSYNKVNLYNKWTEELLTVLATQCAIAIENSRLFDELLLREKENKNLHESLLSMHKFDFIIGSSGKFKEVLELAARASKVRSTVTILGPTGAGKEVLAKAIHYNSPRSKAPFVKVNCAAVPESLLEVELFGIEKSVATGVDARSGKFEAADGGTLFLDEIGDMALATQAKVLRAIQEHEIERIGSNITKKLDIRIIAATNKDIHQLISENKFREDLYYRLNVLVIKIPPLSERRDDIADLAEYFLKKS